MSPEVARRVREDLRASRKYAALAPEALDRIAAWAAARFPKAKDASAAARRQPPPGCGALLAECAPGRHGALLDPGDVSPEARREACRAALALHASTAERLPGLAAFYAAVFARVPPPRSVLDLCCGLHPLGIPWMSLAGGCRYEAWEVDDRLVTLLNGTLPALLPGARAVSRDVLGSAALPEADLVWLLKSLPSLDQQERGAGKALLGRLRAKAVVVSFPARTLGGRDVGMAVTYAKTWEPVFREAGWIAVPLAVPAETAYLLTRR